jgi:hypothetical protein
LPFQRIAPVFASSRLALASTTVVEDRTWYSCPYSSIVTSSTASAPNTLRSLANETECSSPGVVACGAEVLAVAEVVLADSLHGVDDFGAMDVDDVERDLMAYTPAMRLLS